jgi:DNA-binding response OmpR family regulator
MRKRLLIVEDDPDIAWVFRLIFEPRFVVETAPDLATARAAVAGQTWPAVILLDLSLPDGNGLTFCRELKASHPLIPVVVMTAYARHGLVTEADARACGAEGFVPKPFDVDELLATAARLVRRAA